MRTAIGATLATIGIATVLGAAIYDVIHGWPAIVAFFAGLVVAAAGLTVWRGPDWADF